MKLYYSTNEAKAHRILNTGFTDEPFEGSELYGVLLADQPLDEPGDEHLVLDIDEGLIAAFEVVADTPVPGTGSGYGCREWLVPAALVNASGPVGLLEPADDDDKP